MAGSLPVIKAWKEQVIKARAKGFAEHTCAESARVSLAHLKIELSKDPEFRSRYEEAGRNAPRGVTW